MHFKNIITYFIFFKKNLQLSIAKLERMRKIIFSKFSRSKLITSKFVPYVDVYRYKGSSVLDFENDLKNIWINNNFVR